MPRPAPRSPPPGREPWTPSEKVAYGKRLEELERPLAEDRKKAGQEAGRAKQHGKLVEENFPPTNGKTLDKVAEAVGMSAPTYRKARAVVEAAAKPDASPEVREALAEMDRTGKVSAAHATVKNSSKRPALAGPVAAVGEPPAGRTWRDMLKWAVKRKSVTKEDLAARFEINEAECRRRLLTAHESKGYIIAELGDGRYRVRRAVHFTWHDEGGEAIKVRDIMTRLLDMTTVAMKRDNSEGCITWTREERYVYLTEVIKIAKELSS